MKQPYFCSKNVLSKKSTINHGSRFLNIPLWSKSNMWKNVYETVEFVTFPEVVRFQVMKEWKYWSLKKTGMNIRKSLFTQTIPEKNLIKQSKEFAENWARSEGFDIYLCLYFGCYDRRVAGSGICLHPIFRFFQIFLSIKLLGNS